jgi:hypothetical protein
VGAKQEKRARKRLYCVLIKRSGSDLFLPKKITADVKASTTKASRTFSFRIRDSEQYSHCKNATKTSLSANVPSVSHFTVLFMHHSHRFQHTFPPLYPLLTPGPISPPPPLLLARRLLWSNTLGGGSRFFTFQSGIHLLPLLLLLFLLRRRLRRTRRRRRG